LRLDTAVSTASAQPYSVSSVSSTQDLPAPQDVFYDNTPGNGPFCMGRMMDYYSKPGYQLGDSLMNSYSMFQQPMYEYREEYPVLPSWEEANGRL
jgi:hypothetical protein